MKKNDSKIAAIALCKGKSRFVAKVAEAIALAEFGIATEPVVATARSRGIVMPFLELAFWHLPRMCAMWLAAKAAVAFRRDR